MTSHTRATTVLEVLGKPRPLLIGHRGCSREAPENTLPGFELAITAGVDLVEMDYRHCKDGVPIVIHDAELGRTTDAGKRWRRRHIRVDSKTAAEIRTLDAGSWLHPKFAGTRVPLLREALALIRRGSFPLIERKAGDAATCVQLLREQDLINKVVVQSFDWSFLREVHERVPEQVLAALGPPSVLANGKKPLGLTRRLTKGWLAQTRRTGASIAVWNWRVSKAAVSQAHEQGLKVWVYTVNDLKLAAELLRIGIDGIITDKPGVIRKAISNAPAFR